MIRNTKTSAELIEKIPIEDIQTHFFQRKRYFGITKKLIQEQ
jgi:hypothetical protein